MAKSEPVQRHVRRRIRALVIVSTLLIATLWLSFSQQVDDRNIDLGTQALTKPIRLEEIHPGAVDELLLGLRVHHYRAQLIDEAAFTDFFFDTATWDLLGSGYSYRFRVAEATDDADRYSFRLEQEPRFLDGHEEKLDLRSDLPAVLGNQIEAGDWQLALDGEEAIPARDELKVVLRELGIETDSIKPRVRGELNRRRFDITDKGQSWFELDVENWTFRLYPFTLDPTVVTIRNFVLDTRLSGNDPDLTRRVQTMLMLSRMFHGTRATQLAPHEQAIQLWIETPELELEMPRSKTAPP